MNLRSLRGQRTQDEVAQVTGVHQSTISALEAGEVQSPRLDTLQKLADGYGVELSVIVAAVRESVAEAAA